MVGERTYRVDQPGVPMQDLWLGHRPTVVDGEPPPFAGRRSDARG
jgi:hypothetical protein